ncbi:MAG: hypothetical protein PHU40_03080 [Sulfurimonas sp.]|nr:hypothetical protein [Sulfurimonas sp.]
MLRKIVAALCLVIAVAALQAHDKKSPEKQSEDHLLSITTNKNIVVAFDLPIMEDSLDRRTVELKQHHHKRIDGKVTVENTKNLVFTPNDPLEKGEYTLFVKPVELKKCKQTLNWFERWFKKDRCVVMSKPIHHKFHIETSQPKILSLDFNQTTIELKEDTQTPLKLYAHYDDNTTSQITSNIEWSIGDESIIEMKDTNLTALQEGTTTLQASYNGVQSSQISVTVYKEVNGHILPPKPDETLNNSTLLGIDVNNNGVRDDVERWIFLEMKIYNGYEKIEQAIAMQQAKAYQMALADPANTDDKPTKAITAGLECWEWYSYSKQLPFNDGIWDYMNAISDKCFNTRERLKTYLQYDASLSGRVFTSTPTLQTKSQCETDIDGL